MYSTDYMDRARTRAGAYIHSATKSDDHAHAKKSMPSEKRAAGALGLAATRRLLRMPGALPIVEETIDESAREKRRWGPDSARQRP